MVCRPRSAHDQGRGPRVRLSRFPRYRASAAPRPTGLSRARAAWPAPTTATRRTQRSLASG